MKFHVLMQLFLNSDISTVILTLSV